MPPQNTFRTADQALVREINLSLILKHLFVHSPLSRAALAEMTGLNKSTVSSLIQELIDRRFVREVGLVAGSVGRPSIMLELNPQAGFLLSCELGVDFISVVCTNFGAEVIWRHRESTRTHDQQAILDRVVALLRQAANEGQTRCDGCGGLLGLALGVPGLIDQSSGTLLFAPNLQWRDVPLRDILSNAFEGVPVFVDNEANMAALGETLFGAAKGYHEVLFISAGVGLGGALVRDGQLMRGTTGFAGEFGHMTMDPDGDPCNCGSRGCWETQVSQSVVFRYLQQGHSRVLDEVNDLDQLSIPLVIDAARAGDWAARAAFENVGRRLGIGIASLVNALNPDLIVFGGILSLAGEFLLPVIEKELRQRALRWNREATQITLAQYSSDACVMGGAAVICQAILADPALYGVLGRK
ncbi:MAG: ROK family transcriptional regulator [Chloroflexi bacterium]|nr:ROK family transcriptional regulator [Chloroflexota bacterium]